jgi:hypothetical protein
VKNWLLWPLWVICCRPIAYHENGAFGSLAALGLIGMAMTASGRKAEQIHGQILEVVIAGHQGTLK